MTASITRVRRYWLLPFIALGLALIVPISYVLAAPSGPSGAIDDAIAPQPLPAPVDCGDPSPPITSCNVIVNKELMITELCVVEDPVRTKWTATGADPNVLGAWTFGKLMASIGGFPDIDSDPAGLSNFVRNWAAHWATDQFNSNGGGECIAQDRSMNATIIERWERVSQVPPGGVLNMRRAPFRLLAIVNRIDLRKNPVYGNGNAGEARFVFGVLSININNPNPDTWSPLPFTTILEYVAPAATCNAVLNWAHRWHNLGSIPFGEEYNRALQLITDDFAGFNAAPSRPNGSSISQVRTNEIAIGSPWELREFRLTADVDPAPLLQSVVAQNPDLRHNNSPLLADWLTQNEPDILAERHVVPLEFDGECFAGISSKNPQPVWNAPGFGCTETRFKFAFNTCNGCHGQETNTGRFLHVFTRSFNEESDLSLFLKGDPNGVQDPTCGGGVTRFFNDLERRANDLCMLVNSTCHPDIDPVDDQMADAMAADDGDGGAAQAQAAAAAPNAALFDNAPFAAHNRVH